MDLPKKMGLRKRFQLNTRLHRQIGRLIHRVLTRWTASQIGCHRSRKEEREKARRGIIMAVQSFGAGLKSHIHYHVNGSNKIGITQFTSCRRTSVWLKSPVLVSAGRIRIQGELRDWPGRATAGPLVRLCRITPAVVAEASNLPADFHCDPANRIIAATARLERASLLTQDRKAPGQVCQWQGLQLTSEHGADPSFLDGPL